MDMRACLRNPQPRWPARLAAAVLAIGLLNATAPRSALAQEIALSVNGDPITTLDIDERMKLLRALHRPATREAATESMVEDRLKLHEATRYGVNIKDSELGGEVQDIARKAKMSTNVLAQEISRNGVSQLHANNFFRAQLAYSILIRGLNRGVEASEIAVRSELAKEKSKGGATTYTIRQIVFTVNPGAPPTELQAAIKEAQALRTRFTSCETGLPYAKGLPGVAVREKITRSSAQLGDAIKEVLDKTPLGHVTEPTRSPNGVEVVAVCNRTAATDDEELRRTISERLLTQHFSQEEISRYKEMREHAIISRAP